MMLDDKVAVVYGAGGAIGSAVARAFATEGARVFLTGRLAAPVDAVAREIVAAGGAASATQVDALDEQAVDEHLDAVIASAGRVDVSFNAVGIPDADILGVPLVDLDVERFARPIAAYTRSYFLTARLAARRMLPNGSGVILRVTATHARSGIPLVGGYGPAMAAMEALTRELSAELAPARHPRRRPAPAGDARVAHDQGGVRAARRGIRPHLGGVAGDAREPDPPAPADDARGAGERGGLRGVGPGERDDRDDGEPDDGQSRRLRRPCTGVTGCRRSRR